MRFHTNVLPTYVPELNGTLADFYRQIVDQAVLAEELGFDGFWFTEHHFIQYGGAIPNPAVMIASVATRTSRIRLGSCISIVSLHHAIQTAEDYAMADVASNGRLEFGMGAGNTAIDYEVY
ncbi:MAG: LLM class flavin-dependent oxidoreductase, partial [Chloroflexi bacterium]|nr:LLM class flavin-dependent oxidoreductase [Chloroflexota bacterium]